MCGIVGYVGNKRAKPILINGLNKLEYRGYDSAGIATLETNGIVCIKNKGRVKALENISGLEKLEGNIGIAHTRWATHGKPSKENSHPHLDNSKEFAVVHNGIIENYMELKDFLINKGYKFLSQTDTEIIPNLIHYYFKQEKDVLKAVKLACDKMIGSYAIEVISNHLENKMIVTRKASPIVIGKGKDENYISSDIPAILEYTKSFYFLNDGEYTIVDKNEVEFYDSNLNKISKEIKIVEWQSDSASKGCFEDYMIKEIFEQNKTVKETIGYRLPKNGKSIVDEIELSKEYLEKISKIYIVACGTAMHAGLVGKNMFEQICNIPVEVEMASEFRYKNPIVNSKTLTIFISQSGETADTIAALKLAKAKAARTIAITNVMGSSITREAEYVLYTCAGPEIAVASTKAYTSQIIILAILAMNFAERMGKNIPENLKEEILLLPNKIEDILADTDIYKDIAKKIKDERDVFFLGRGIDYTVAMEASLKLKEITYIHSDSYASGELKHGPIALIEDNTKVISILTDKNLVEKSLSNLQEVISRGAKVTIITNQDIKGNYTIIKIPETNKLISPVLSIIPLQLIAYYVAKEKGLDVDKPRNLAKSVTVE